MSEWQPIETAPKDGRIVIGWRYYPVAIRWDKEKDSNYPWDAIHLDGCYTFDDNAFVENDDALTHWMPLPEPPEDE